MRECPTILELTRAVAAAEIEAAGEHNDMELKGLARAAAQHRAESARISRARHIMTCPECLDAIRAAARAEIFGRTA
jgi:hypothetical protein